MKTLPNVSHPDLLRFNLVYLINTIQGMINTLRRNVQYFSMGCNMYTCAMQICTKIFFVFVNSV